MRALRICSEEHLRDEFGYLYEAFMKLKYPESLEIKLQEKAKRIAERSRSMVTTDTGGTDKDLVTDGSTGTGSVEIRYRSGPIK